MAKTPNKVSQKKVQNRSRRKNNNFKKKFCAKVEDTLVKFLGWKTPVGGFFARLTWGVIKSVS